MNEQTFKTAASAAGAALPMLEDAGGPLGLAGRLVGMGGDELDAGVPGWGWFGAGLVVGMIGMYVLRPRIEAFVEG